jgi:hypothetical protein
MPIVMMTVVIVFKTHSTIVTTLLDHFFNSSPFLTHSFVPYIFHPMMGSSQSPRSSVEQYVLVASVDTNRHIREHLQQHPNMNILISLYLISPLFEEYLL